MRDCQCSEHSSSDSDVRHGPSTDSSTSGCRPARRRDSGEATQTPRLDCSSASTMLPIRTDRADGALCHDRSERLSLGTGIGQRIGMQGSGCTAEINRAALTEADVLEAIRRIGLPAKPGERTRVHPGQPRHHLLHHPNATEPHPHHHRLHRHRRRPTHHLHLALGRRHHHHDHHPRTAIPAHRHHPHLHSRHRPAPTPTNSPSPPATTPATASTTDRGPTSKTRSPSPDRPTNYPSNKQPPSSSNKAATMSHPAMRDQWSGRSQRKRSALPS